MNVKKAHPVGVPRGAEFCVEENGVRYYFKRGRDDRLSSGRSHTEYVLVSVVADSAPHGRPMVTSESGTASCNSIEAITRMDKLTRNDGSIREAEAAVAAAQRKLDEARAALRRA